MRVAGDLALRAGAADPGSAGRAVGGRRLRGDLALCGWASDFPVGFYIGWCPWLPKPAKNGSGKACASDMSFARTSRFRLKSMWKPILDICVTQRLRSASAFSGRPAPLDPGNWQLGVSKPGCKALNQSNLRFWVGEIDGPGRLNHQVNQCHLILTKTTKKDTNAWRSLRGFRTAVGSRGHRGPGPHEKNEVSTSQSNSTPKKNEMYRSRVHSTPPQNKGERRKETNPMAWVKWLQWDATHTHTHTHAHGCSTLYLTQPT